MAEGKNTTYYNGISVVTIHCEDPVDAAIITILDRLASAVERYVDNRQ